MEADLRSALVGALERLGRDIAVGRYDDPHVGFVVLVSADRAPQIAVLTGHGANDMSKLGFGTSDTAAKPERAERWFTVEEFQEAAGAMRDTEMAMRTLQFRGEMPWSEHLAATVDDGWARRRQYPVDRALAKAADEAARPAVCTACRRRFTERGLKMHQSRSPRCASAVARGEAEEKP